MINARSNPPRQHKEHLVFGQRTWGWKQYCVRLRLSRCHRSEIVCYPTLLDQPLLAGRDEGIRRGSQELESKVAAFVCRRRSKRLRFSAPECLAPIKQADRNVG